MVDFIQYQIDFMACMQRPMSPNRRIVCTLCIARTPYTFQREFLLAVDYWKAIADIAPFTPQSTLQPAHSHSNFHFSLSRVGEKTSRASRAQTLKVDRNAKGNCSGDCIIHKIKCEGEKRVAKILHVSM